ncbi:MAG: AAA family ATPase [Lachnospiraceae bacterium]|nr:AAA family ATPase [Lachnospiraceae bacterium]
MDQTKYMVVIKDEICTKRVKSCVSNTEKNRCDVTFTNNKLYSYSFNNVVFMSDPTVLDPNDYKVSTLDGKQLFGIKWIYQFENKDSKYWHIVFEGYAKSYKCSDLLIIKNSLSEEKSNNVFKYLTEVSGLSDIQNNNGENILKKNYERISFLPDYRALSLFLDPDKKIETKQCNNVIFPFGCNQSQYKAVINALSNQISVIQGPPGTGKTQTILNIISNLIVSGKTVIVVSNNNSATQNVMEKLSKQKYGMDFMVASLGSMENKSAFVDAQTGLYPDLSAWVDENANNLKKEASDLAGQLQNVYQLKEELAIVKEKRYEIDIEAKHFKEFKNDTAADYQTVKARNRMTSDKIMQLWQELQEKADDMKSLSFLFKLKSILYYGITNWDFYKQDLSKMITVLQGMYYEQSIKECDQQIETITNKLNQNSGDKEKELEEKSLAYLKSYIAGKYNWNERRKTFSNDDLYKNASAVLNEYPIVLSTTFSAMTSLNWQNAEYDYVIMDEASQVDLATGALSLSCAKNAVIVGDLKQLPNVVTTDIEKKADIIRTHYKLNQAYDYSRKSFLQSVVELFPSIPSTLLREHYRCHPRIIQFCNQKFYNNELVIMTQDDNKGNALKAVKTVEGNHARGNYNQRQIDVIKNEVLPFIDAPKEQIGIIAPYNEQVNEIRKQIPDIDAATVHKFQGREKDVIILSTVDNQIRDFTDDPYLLNVAVSRAKKQLIVIVSGNKQGRNGNIIDLVSYIQYNKMDVVESAVYSVFDYLYAQYRDRRWEKLKKHNISEYESENLTYSLLLDILKDLPDYDVVCFEPLSMIIRDVSKLSPEEIKYAMSPSTHLDFTVFNKFNKQPVLAVETDGYAYHKEGTEQHERDIKKNSILEKCGIPLLRLKTNESNERAKIIQALNQS